MIKFKKLNQKGKGKKKSQVIFRSLKPAYRVRTARMGHVMRPCFKTKYPPQKKPMCSVGAEMRSFYGEISGYSRCPRQERGSHCFLLNSLESKKPFRIYICLLTHPPPPLLLFNDLETALTRTDKRHPTS